MSNSSEHKKNYNKLLKKGVDKAWLNQQFGGNDKYNLVQGNYINNQDVDDVWNAWVKEKKIRDTEATKLADLDKRTPDFMKSDPNWAKLTVDQKELAVYNYEIQKANNEAKAKALAQALEQATAQAEPYWKNMLLVAQDEVLRGFEEARGDYDSSVQRQLRIIDNVNQDLTYNKNYLSLEQQSDLAKLARDYQASHDQILESAAGAGLTFSTKRKMAEQRLAEENKSMVESTQRSYNKQLRDLEVGSQRDIIESQSQIADLQRRVQQQTTSLGREAEAKLGTENLPNLTGYTPLGTQENPITGTMYEEKVKDINARQQAIYNDLTANSLNLTQ